MQMRASGEAPLGRISIFGGLSALGSSIANRKSQIVVWVINADQVFDYHKDVGMYIC